MTVEQTYTVTGMTCGHCVTSVTEDSVGRLVEIAWVTYRADRFVFTMTSLRSPSLRQVPDLETTG